ncbi:MAG: thiol-disulfide oxidoreductase DCC family protein [Cecembia sp.]
MRVQDQYDIVLFDGVCNLCNNAVDFIMQRDKKRQFKVGALQDEHVKKMLKSYEINEEYLDSLVLIRKDQVFYKSRAALEISRKLNALWPLFYGFIIIPAFIRDPIYDWIATNRYKWFGKKETCRLPSEEEQNQFLSEEDML